MLNRTQREKDQSLIVVTVCLIQIPLWFTIERPPTPDDPSQSSPYNREQNLKQFWFDLFASQEHPGFLPYEDMLLYLAAVPNPLHGLYRALAIAERTLMPTLRKQLPHVTMHCPSLSTQEYDRLLEKEREQADNGVIHVPNEGLVSIDSLYYVRWETVIRFH